MRLQSLVALLLISMALAGCSGDDGDSTETTTTTTNTTTTTTTTTTNSTPPAPNEPPVAALTVTNDTGAETDFVDLGGNLTFDGSASEDPDGEITEMAITVTDANNSRTAQLLQGGQFTPVTFNFDRPGVVTVVANVLDDRGERTSLTTEVYINHPQTLGSFTFNGADPAGLVPATDCSGAIDVVVDPAYIKKFDFDVKAGATYVEASVAFSGFEGEVDGGGRFAICDPDGVALSGEGSGDETITTEPGSEFTASLNYAVWVVSEAPGTTAQPSVVVHYEPQDAVTPGA